MKCPKCGYVRQNRDNVFAPPTECPACGVVYAKYLTGDTSSTFGALDASAGLKKASPVDEETLKKARDRVERRLRKKINPKEKDEYREQTLQRARLFVSEGIKKRREEAQQRKGKEQDEALPEEAPAQDTPDDADRMEPSIEPSVEPSVEMTEESASALSEASPVALSEEIALELSGEPSAELSEEPVLELSEASSAEPSAESPAGRETPDADQAEAASNHEDQPTEQAASEMTAPPDDADEAVQETESEDRIAAVQEATATDVDAAGEAEEIDDRVFTIGAAETPEPVEEDTPSLGLSEGEGEMSETPSVEPNLAALLAAASTNGRLATTRRGGGLLRLLPAVAWMILVAGVIGAILSWTTIGDVQAGINLTDLKSGSGLPVALLLGFAYLATGVLGFAFFWVSSIINMQLKEIHLLLLQPLAGSPEETGKE